MDSKRIMRNLIFTMVIFSVAMFFLFPRHEYVPKLLYVAIAGGFACWHAARRNLRASLICCVGAVVILLTLPTIGALRTGEVILIALICVLSFYLHHRSKRRALRNNE